jgi:hypothetical protein
MVKSLWRGRRTLHIDLLAIGTAEPIA